MKIELYDLIPLVEKAAKYDAIINYIKTKNYIDKGDILAFAGELVSAGLKSKISAIMEIMKCDEETARAELERINAEAAVAGVSDGEGFGGGDMNDEGAV